MADLARTMALQALHSIDKNGAYSNLAVGEALKNTALSAADRRFITELVHGVVRYRLHLDYIAAQFSKVKKVSGWVQNIIRLGLYQIWYLDRVPDSAAVNESVRLARRFGGTRAAGFVNGLLRTCIRERNNICYPADPLEALCITQSFPVWLGKRWRDEGGLEFAERLMCACNEKPSLTIRCNTTKTTPENLAEEIVRAGGKPTQVQFSAAPQIDYALSISGLTDFTSLDAFQNGHFYIQDPGAMLVTEVLDSQPGETILDICAAPGGKSTHIAEKMGDTGTVIACDLYPHKAAIIQQNAARLGLHCIQAKTADTMQGLPELEAKADRVLADVPCSGFGVIRHKPEIKYARKPEDLAAFAVQSRKILDSAAKCVKPGGVLVFSTCTIEQAENGCVVDAFLREHSDFQLAPISCVTIKNSGTLSLYPHINGTDGFFIAKLQKTGGRK